MKLAKAIEILNLIADTPPSGASPDFKDAIKLGIGAMSRIDAVRKHQLYSVFPSLPGETED